MAQERLVRHVYPDATATDPDEFFWRFSLFLRCGPKHDVHARELVVRGFYQCMGWEWFEAIRSPRDNDDPWIGLGAG